MFRMCTVILFKVVTDLNYGKSALVQDIAWCSTGKRPISEPITTKLFDTMRCYKDKTNEKM